MRAQQATGYWRSYFQISIGAFVLLVLILGGGFGWMVHCARVQRDAVDAIRRADGSVWYGWQYKKGTASRSWISESRAPRWLINALGVDYFDTAVAVEQMGWLTHSLTFTDNDMIPVGRLTGLVELKIRASSVSDAGLVHLNRLTSLQRILLYGSNVTDAGLIHLRGLTQLQQLVLVSARIKDSGLVHLKGLTNLRELDLSDTEVSDAGLLHLRGLSNLRTLDVTETRVTEAGVRALLDAIPGIQIRAYVGNNLL